MSRYRIEYAPAVAASRKAMGAGLRASFDSATRDLAAAPYGCGSAPIGVSATGGTPR